MTTNYAILTASQLNSSPYLDVGRTFVSLGAAEDYILATSEENHIAVLAVDMHTGATVAKLNRRDIEQLIEKTAQRAEAANWENDVYGSYTEQHRKAMFGAL